MYVATFDFFAQSKKNTVELVTSWLPILWSNVTVILVSVGGYSSHITTMDEERGPEGVVSCFSKQECHRDTAAGEKTRGSRKLDAHTYRNITMMTIIMQTVTW